MKKARAMKESVASKIAGRLGKFVEALQQDKVIAEHFTCRTVLLDLHPAAYDARRVIKTRKLLGTSQSVFARFLGVKTRTVQAWEQGENVPSDIACRFMDEIQLNPAYWQRRLRDVIQVKVPTA